MNLYAHTLAEYLVHHCRPCLAGTTGSKEFRAVLSSAPPAVILQTGTALEEFLAGNPQNIKFFFQVGYGLYQHWQTNDPESVQESIDQLDEKRWIDKDDKLTHYRNLKLEDFPGYDNLVIILIGIDYARDSGGLEDFFRLDGKTVWDEALNRSFIPWVNRLFTEKNIYAEDEHFDDIDALLQQLHKQGTGDFLSMASFLGEIDFNGVQDGKDALLAMYNNLGFWDLPPCRELPQRRKSSWPDYIQEAAKFFSYQSFLKNSERKKILDNIDRFAEKVERGTAEISFSVDQFIDTNDFLVNLRKYIRNNDASARKRILRTDFAPIQDKILKFKKPGKIPTPPKLTKIDASPLETVLTALWYCLVDFKKSCGDQSPAELLEQISITGRKFRHDLDTADDGIDLLRGCLGGLDAYIEKKIRITVELDGAEKNIAIKSALLSENVSFERVGAGIPGFQFIIHFQTQNQQGVQRTFQWQVPATQPERNLWNLARAIREKLPSADPCLPVFSISYYDELFLASDEDEINRILQLGLKNLEVINFLDLPELTPLDPIRPLLHDLSHEYGKFIQAMDQEGMYTALDGPWPKFANKYKEILKSFTRDQKVGPTNPYAPLVYKSFAIMNAKDLENPHTNYLPTAVLTGMHPALLEMLESRDIFLVHGFISKTENILVDRAGMKISLQQWGDVCDLAKINYPLFGLISDSSKTLNTSIKSHGLIHCFGNPPESTTPLSAKMLLRADENEEEDITDTVLFRENRESRVIKRFLEEYVMVYPHAIDGISLAVINPDAFQPLISGINSFLMKRLESKSHEAETSPYHFSLTIFTTDEQQQEASRYLQEWKKRWEIARETTKFSFYKNCRLSIAHRIAHDIQDYERLIKREDFEADLALLMNFISASDAGNEVEKTEPYQVDLAYSLKFPVVETPCCSNDLPAHMHERATVISNRRFRLATLHSELGVYFKHPGYALGQEFIVISKGNYGKWLKLIEKLHEKATWVVCLDPAIDEKLTRNVGIVGLKEREIIGFSAGLGFRGELNYTVSTERSSLVDIKAKVAKQLNRICGPWKKHILDNTVHRLVDCSRLLSGLSLVRATGSGERNIRELIASTLVRMSLPEPDEKKTLLCDELISLDSFIHWFDTSYDPNRPDLLRIVAHLVAGNRIVIDAHIIECKLANTNEDHLNKAHVQLESGLRHLVKVFSPRTYSSKNRKKIPIDFDQRYWWAQLQRLIASKSRVTSKQKAAVTFALEQLGEGKFVICWRAMAVVYWTDNNSDSYTLDRQWDFYFQGRPLKIDVIFAGKETISSICDRENEIKIPCSDSKLCIPEEEYESAKIETTTDENIAEDINIKEPENCSAEKEQEKYDTKEKASSGGPSERTEEGEPDEDLGAERTAEHDPECEGDKTSQSVVIAQVPDRILLGDTLGMVKREVFWEFGHSQLANRHILIFGNSGMGKTYAIQCILLELAKQSQRCVIVDYTMGFLPKHLEPQFTETVQPEQHVVINSPLPINPFRAQRMLIDEGIETIENPYTIAGRVTSVFTAVYDSFGEQQKALLQKVIEQGVIAYTEEGYDFGKLLKDLEDDGSSHSQAVVNKLTPLGRAALFQSSEKNSWQEMYTDSINKINILQLAGLPRDIARMTTEFILWDLYDFARNQGNKKYPLPMVLDEIQNLDHRLDAPLAKFLTEGRKFGLAAILATQTLSNLALEERSRLFMASHKLFFRPADTELKEYATILANATSENVNIWKEKLVVLQKGECYSLGPSLNPHTKKLEEKAFPIRITALSERLAK